MRSHNLQYKKYLKAISYKLKADKGFTLVELIVSVGIFALVMTTALGSLMTIINANRETRAMQLVLDNVQFAVDEMVRDIRTGTGYNFPGTNNDCTGVEFTFTDAAGDLVKYRCGSDGSIEKKVGGGPYQSTTAPEITITKLKFIEKENVTQPLMLVVIAGEAESRLGEVEKFSLQTLVSQRFLDN